MAEYPVTFLKQGYTKQYPEGSVIGDILKQEAIGTPFICNGQGTCGKCRLKATGLTSPPTFSERKLIPPSDLEAGIRLACQVRTAGPVQLETAAEANKLNILEEGYFKEERFDPLWSWLVLPRPPAAGWETIAKLLPPGVKSSLPVLQELALLQPEIKNLTLEWLGSKALAVHPGEANPERFAVAIDIGTTTLAAYLVDLSNGKIRETASMYNPQGNYGADVISRIQFAGSAEGLAKLHQSIIAACNSLISELVSKQGITRGDIIQLHLVGNSCMMHLLLKVSPAGLGQIPFEPVFKDFLQLTPGETGLDINPGGLVFMLPGIGGFVGSDISAGALACKLGPQKNELFIDIGTNGEVVITGVGKMLACSTAAGPAFEGATISCGMLAKPGAITDISIDEDAVVVTTLNQAPPQGICGTGLIRSLVELIRKGFITETGRWADGLSHPNYNPGQKRFYLVKDNAKPVFITQQDIRQFQLAKGAIRAGLELLLKRLNLSAGELETVYLAGAFGTYLRPEDAIFLGLLPAVSLERVRAAGNTAGMGAVQTILSKTALENLSSLVAGIEHVELAGDPCFTDVFTESMLFNIEV